MGHMVGGYELLRSLGSGGSGTVWEARDEAGNTYALKLLHPAVAASEESRKRLIREARLVNSISGGGVARVIDFEAEAAEPFVVTELIEGPTLAEVVAEAPLSVEEAHFLGIQLQDILQRVHRAGVVHRDLKPANVILSENGPVLIDFGIADGDASENVTQTGVVNGTPGYVSPELLQTATRPSFSLWRVGDWWAWSALLLSSLTGRPPFGKGEIQGVLDRVFRGSPDVAGLDPDTARTMAMALAPSNADRWSPEQVLRSLVSPPTLPVTGEPRTLRSLRPMRPTRPVLQVAFALFGVLALLPAFFQFWGLVGALLPVLALATVGTSLSWAEKHPLVRVAALPINLATAALALVPGAALAAGVATALWWGIKPELTPPLIWVAAWCALVVLYLTPTSRPLREGMRQVFGRLGLFATWVAPLVISVTLAALAFLYWPAL